jgi:hypothetical protein
VEINKLQAVIAKLKKEFELAYNSNQKIVGINVRKLRIPHFSGKKIKKHLHNLMFRCFFVLQNALYFNI